VVGCDQLGTVDKVDISDPRAKEPDDEQLVDVTPKPEGT
jgi:hypothetical protein